MLLSNSIPILICFISQISFVTSCGASDACSDALCSIILDSCTAGCNAACTQCNPPTNIGNVCKGEGQCVFDFSNPNPLISGGVGGCGCTSPDSNFNDYCAVYTGVECACSQCQPGYYQVGTQCSGVCSDSHCSAYGAALSCTCTTCASGFHPVSGVCQACPSIGQCVSYDASCGCTSCNPGYTGSSCSPCSVSHCGTYSHDCTCSNCVPSYQLVGLACNDCGVANCTSYSGGCNCSSCAAGFKAVGFQCHACNSAHCLAYGNTGECECAACASPFLLDHGQCTGCTGNPASAISAQLDATCSSAWTASGMQCNVSCSSAAGEVGVGFFTCSNTTWTPSSTPYPTPACVQQSNDPQINSPSKSQPAGAIAGGTIAIFFLLLLIFLLCRWQYRQRKVLLVEGTLEAEIEMGDQIAKGSTSVVYRGTWHGAEVAVKAVSPTDAEGSRELRNEVTISAKLAHPRLIMCLASSVDPSSRLLMLSELHTGSLQHVLIEKQSYPLTENVSAAEMLTNLRIVMQMLVDSSAAVLALHTRHILHRDIGARNFLVSKSDPPRVVLADLGRAVALAEDKKGLQGKPEPIPIRWCAPEVLLHHVYSPASDVYAFGVFMYEVFARELPYSDKTLIEVAVGVVNAQETLKLPIPGCYPMELRHVLIGCLEYDAEKRPTIATVNEKLMTYMTEVNRMESIEQIYTASGPRPAQTPVVLQDEAIQYQPYRHLDSKGDKVNNTDDIELKIH